MRKELEYRVRPSWVCSCGARYDEKPEKCTIVIGTEHAISKRENRDAEKVYVIREMPARQAVRWAVKFFAVLINSGLQVPDNLIAGGIAGVASMGFDSIRRINPDEASEVLEDLIACVRIRPDSRNPAVERPLIDDDIEEIETYFALAREAFNLHVGFSKGAGPLTPA